MELLVSLLVLNESNVDSSHTSLVGVDWAIIVVWIKLLLLGVPKNEVVTVGLLSSDREAVVRALDLNVLKSSESLDWARGGSV